MADDLTFFDAIEGYCGALSCAPGEPVTLHVSTRAPAFDVTIERWGATRHPVFGATGLSGAFHEVPADADAHGCGWPVALEVSTDETWVSGFHLVTLTAHDAPPERATAHAGFVVRGASSTRRDALLVLGTNTWHAYNPWGGRSLYTGGTRVSHARPFARGMLCRPEVERDDRKARPVYRREETDDGGAVFQAYRLERGYPAAIGSSGWFTYERRFVEWAEDAGYEFDYAVSADLDADPDLLAGYDLVMCVGHDEYWSAGQRRAVERHIERGGNLATFSGNTSFWQVRLEDGERGPAMVCHKYRAHLDDPVLETDPARMTGMFADPIVGDPEWAMLGAGSAFGLYHRFGQATARGVGGFIVYRDDHWLVDGTGLRYGDVLGADDGVVGYETVGCPIAIDDLQLPVAAPHPGLAADIEIVGLAPSSNLRVGEYPASISALSDQGDLEFIAERIFGGTDERAMARARHGNAVMLTCRPYAGGGEVVTIGTTDWVFGLAADAAVARVTANVLERLR